MGDVTITARLDGPYLITETVKIIDGATGQEIPVPRYPTALCRCGGSANKPFCDGTHKRIGFKSASAPKP